MTQPVDRLFVHCSELLTLADGPPTGLRRSDALRRVGCVADGAVAVRDGVIVATGPTAEMREQHPADEELDLSGFVVMPGLVDAHSHPVFVPPAGLHDIVEVTRRVREAPLEELAAATRTHLDAFVARGTTTVEAKGGYGFDVAVDEKVMRALDAAVQASAPLVHRTYMAAHAVPAELVDDREDYVRSVVTETLPAVSELCDSCDVHLDAGGLDIAQAREVLAAAQAKGLRLRLQADPVPLRGAELGVELGAASVDHLAGISVDGLERLAGANTAAVLLPAAVFELGGDAAAPGRALVDHGCAVALGTDFGPLGSAVPSMVLVMALARRWLGLSVEECINAATINAAASLGLDERVGSLHAGKRADLIALDLPSFGELGTVLDGGALPLVVVGGEPVMVSVQERTPQL